MQNKPPSTHSSNIYDYVIIGGGFYGCCLALFLRSISKRILIIEKSNQLMSRASQVNQARVHTGFHYPRNFVTALRSATLRQKFIHDFPEAIVSNFQMLYGISNIKSKVTAKRFFRTFNMMGVSIKEANQSQKNMFNTARIDNVFMCEEYAFNYQVVRDILMTSLSKVGIEVCYNAEVLALKEMPENIIVEVAGQAKEIVAKNVFNVTYAQLNHILELAKKPLLPLKYEWAEIALIKPPESLHGFGITVMDGPFFSTMPFPSTSDYSLTHVRYTPHRAWQYKNTADAYEYAETLSKTSMAGYMIKDATRYLPAMQESTYQKSLFDVKAVLMRNETDDGRPILCERAHSGSRLISVMGGKIDNIYDLFSYLNDQSEFAEATTKYMRVEG